MRLVVLAAIAAAAVLVTTLRPAHACSCAFTPGISPADGATDVPTNMVAVVMNGRSSFEGGYVLVGPAADVAVEVLSIVDQPSYRLELVRPLQALEPLTEYTLMGPRATVTFQTGADADLGAPEPVGLGELTVAHANVSDDISFSCGNEYSFVELDISPPDDAVAIDVHVDIDGVGSDYVIPAERFSWDLSSWSSGCEMEIALPPGAATCFSIRARDAAGNLSEPVERCATVTACADIPDPDLFDGDLSDCDPPQSGGCRSTAGATPLPLAALLLAVLYAVRRSCRYARKCRIAARADSRSPARS